MGDFYGEDARAAEAAEREAVTREGRERQAEAQNNYNTERRAAEDRARQEEEASERALGRLITKDTDAKEADKKANKARTESLDTLYENAGKNRLKTEDGKSTAYTQGEESLNALPGKGFETEAPKSTIPSWWDYMKQTKGSAGGAIASIAGGVAGNIGAGLSRAAAAATGGKKGNANSEFDGGDSFGSEGYRQLQHDSIQGEQDFNQRKAEAELEEEANNKAAEREERMATHKHNLDVAMANGDHERARQIQYDQLQDLVSMSEITHEQSKDLLHINEQLSVKQQEDLARGLAMMGHDKDISQGRALIARSMNAITDAEYVQRMLNLDAQTARLFNDIIRSWTLAGRNNPGNTTDASHGGSGSSSDSRAAHGGFAGHGDKYEPMGIYHGGEYIVPKEGVNQETGKVKASYIDKITDGYKEKQLGQKRKSKDLTLEEKLNYIKRGA